MGNPLVCSVQWGFRNLWYIRTILRGVRQLLMRKPIATVYFEFIMVLIRRLYDGYYQTNHH